MNYGAKKYKQTSVTTASKEKILLMLYEAAIKNLKLAKMAIEQKKISEKCTHITKAHDIISELSNTLDHSKGPEVTEQLESLYSFCVNQLIKANMENDPKMIDSVLQVMTTLYEGWVAAVEELKKKGGGAERENN
ncbi:flagellar export chaperone FliS [bacterium]|nr:flagellar export chaperone FliS [bacterium]